MRHRVRACLLVGLAVLAPGLSHVARANAIVKYDFSGNITQVDNPTGVLGSQFQTGAPFKLEVTLPADTPNVLGSNPDYGHYTLPQPGMSLTINGQPYALGPADATSVAEVVVIPGAGQLYGLQAFLYPSDPSVNSVRLQFSLASTSGALSSDALPTSLNVANFTGSTPMFELNFFYRDNHALPMVLGTITSASATVLGAGQPVPEPGTFAILALGAAGLLGVGRRRKTSFHSILSPIK